MIKNEKGITMIVLLVTVVLLATITMTLANNSFDASQLSKITKLNNDIQVLNDRVAAYYVENGSLPTIGNPYTKQTLGSFIKDISVNDGNEYYTIDLGALENLSLNYGKDYKEFGGDSYIINVESHVIYRMEGINYKGTVYHTVGKNSSVILDM